MQFTRFLTPAQYTIWTSWKVNTVDLKTLLSPNHLGVEVLHVYA